jgi:MFS transporter, YNFM family, putative membrane transport protein
MRITRGSRAFRAASLALFLAGFSTFSLLYCVQPLLPIFAYAFHVSPASSALPMSLATAPLALAILAAAALSEGWGRRGFTLSRVLLCGLESRGCCWGMVLCA